MARSVFGGESFFMNIYKASAQGGEINLAPALFGDMFVVELQNLSLILVQSGGFGRVGDYSRSEYELGGAKGFWFEPV